MPEPESEQPSSRRRSTQRQRHRRQLRKRVFTGISIGIVVVVAALWFSDTLRIPTDGPSFASSIEPRKTDGQSNDATTPTTATRRALTPLTPLRLWIGGDSLAGALGPALGEMTAATGVVQPTYDYRQGSGLMSGDVQWMQRANDAMVTYDPEVVVFMIGTNDAVIYSDRDEAKYEQLTEAMMRILAGEGREVYWVNAPVMRDEDTEANVKKVDAIQRRVAARFKNVTFVDAHTLFADETGDYVSSLPDETGDDVVMRAGDGIHLTGDGAKHLARAIYGMLDPLWKITEQQVVGQEKKVIVAEDSDSAYGGGSGSSGSGSGSGSGSSSSGNQSWRSNSSSSGSSSGTTPTSSTPSTSAPPPPPPSTSATTTPTTPASTPPASNP